MLGLTSKAVGRRRYSVEEGVSRVMELQSQWLSGSWFAPPLLRFSAIYAYR